MIGTHDPRWTRTIHYWPYWFVGRHRPRQPRLWPWVLVGLALVVLVWTGVRP